jgi:DNA-directed RNA polymerase specialized sigma24 family protein
MQQQTQCLHVLHGQAEDVGDQPVPVSPAMVLWLQRPPAAAFDALLDQADPQGDVPVVAETRANRRLCGRWLAVQRLRLGMSSEVVAERAAMHEPTLLLLESGLATETQVPDSTREQLSSSLAGTEHDQGWVLDVVSIALGRSNAREAHVLQQIAADLHSPRVDPTAPAQLDDGYQLFHRTIVGRDADAWAEIHTRYRALLISWVQRCSATALVGEECADLADQAFARAWRALTPERFAQFPSLAALLAYLRTCVTAVVIDAARAQAARQRMVQRLEHVAAATPEQVALAAASREELWRIIASLILSEQERVVLVESCINELSPRDIQAHHSQLFPDVAAVYTIKRNLLIKLQRKSRAGADAP